MCEQELAFFPSLLPTLPISFYNLFRRPSVCVLSQGAFSLLSAGKPSSWCGQRERVRLCARIFARQGKLEEKKNFEERERERARMKVLVTACFLYWLFQVGTISCGTWLSRTTLLDRFRLRFFLQSLFQRNMARGFQFSHLHPLMQSFVFGNCLLQRPFVQ